MFRKFLSVVNRWLPPRTITITITKVACLKYCYASNTACPVAMALKEKLGHNEIRVRPSGADIGPSRLWLYDLSFTPWDYDKIINTGVSKTLTLRRIGLN